MGREATRTLCSTLVFYLYMQLLPASCLNQNSCLSAPSLPRSSCPAAPPSSPCSFFFVLPLLPASLLLLLPPFSSCSSLPHVPVGLAPRPASASASCGPCVSGTTSTGRAHPRTASSEYLIYPICMSESESVLCNLSYPNPILLTRYICVASVFAIRNPVSRNSGTSVLSRDFCSHKSESPRDGPASCVGDKVHCALHKAPFKRCKRELLSMALTLKCVGGFRVAEGSRKRHHRS